MELKVNRRSFLKLLGASGAAGTLLTPMVLSNAQLEGQEDKLSDAALTGDYEWRNNICTFCASTCGIRVAVKEVAGRERAVKIEGNPHDAFNRGHLCARGQSGLRRLYSEDRIRQPLIRVEGSKRGEWAFRAASWDEAYDYIMDKIETHNIQPYEMALLGGWFICAFYRFHLVAFALTANIPNIIGTPLQYCIMGEHFGLNTVTGNFNPHAEMMADYGNAKYILALRSNAALAGISTGRAVRFAEAVKNGAKVVVLDPRMSELAAKADEWIPIKPGTDQALLLVILNTLIQHERYDEAFARTHTNVPFLAYMDGDNMVLTGELNDSTGDLSNAQVYDEMSGEIRTLTVPDNRNDRDEQGNKIRPALEVPECLTYNGQPVRTVLQFLRDQVRDYTPEWAAEITDVAAEKIAEIADEFTLTRPALMEPGWFDGRYENHLQTHRTKAMIQALMGGIDRPGGWVFSGGYHEVVKDYWEGVWNNERTPMPPGAIGPNFMQRVFFTNKLHWRHRHPSVSHAWNEQEWAAGRDGVAFSLFTDAGYLESVQGKVDYDGDPYQVKAFFGIASNMTKNFNKHWVDILSSDTVKLNVSIDIQSNDSLRYADVILPDLSYLEHYDQLFHVEAAHELQIITRDPVKPVVDGRHMLDIFVDLAERMGFYRNYLYGLANLLTLDGRKLYTAVDEARKQGLPSGLALRVYTTQHLAEKLGVDPSDISDNLLEDGIYHLLDAEEMLHEAGIPFKYPAPTQSGRMELFSSQLADFVQQRGYKDNWNPTTTYVPPMYEHGHEGPLPDNEFFFNFGKLPTMSHSATAGNDLLAALTETKGLSNYGVWINPRRAEALDLHTGDWIEIKNAESPDHHTLARAYITEMTRPDTIFMASNAGARHGESEAERKWAPINALIPYRLDPGLGALKTCEFTVLIRKVDAPAGFREQERSHA
jgi:anaerobic selenocysteine-containing dehydrogenase